jgi:hypothetical protein
MAARKTFLTPVGVAFLVFVLQEWNPCFAGYYSAGGGYRAIGSTPVYGFGKTGQSFTYQQYGSAPSYIRSSGTTGTRTYGPQYRFDSFTRPESRSSYQSIYSSPSFFAGKIWYPRGY